MAFTPPNLDAAESGYELQAAADGDMELQAAQWWGTQRYATPDVQAKMQDLSRQRIDADAQRTHKDPWAKLDVAFHVADADKDGCGRAGGRAAPAPAG